jgi:hypothetical protein
MYRVAPFIRKGGSETPEQWLSLTGPVAQNDTDYSSGDFQKIPKEYRAVT